MRRWSASSALFCLLTLSTLAATLPELFQKVKTEFRLGAYADALKTLDVLARETEKPGNEDGRAALERGILFYRAACLAALGQDERARELFGQFLAFEPNARLDPLIYPKKVINALEEARQTLGRERDKSPGKTASLAKSYQAFTGTAVSEKTVPLDEWANGPVRFIMTADEKREFLGLSDPASRSEFVTNFWRARDRKPETPENEFREEFEKRVAFADTHFTEGEVPGSLTDRGMVFILLGPPTYVGGRPLGTGDDTADPSGLSRFSHSDVTIATKPGGTTADRANRIDQVTGPLTTVRDAAAKSWIETWYYYRELLPAGLPFQHVDFKFITKQGYGNNILQRDATSLNALEAARKVASESSLNHKRP